MSTSTSPRCRSSTPGSVIGLASSGAWRICSPTSRAMAVLAGDASWVVRVQKSIRGARLNSVLKRAPQTSPRSAAWRSDEPEAAMSASPCSCIPGFDCSSRGDGAGATPVVDANPLARYQPLTYAGSIVPSMPGS